jgi:hypothetical protein
MAERQWESCPHGARDLLNRKPGLIRSILHDFRSLNPDPGRHCDYRWRKRLWTMRANASDAKNQAYLQPSFRPLRPAEQVVYLPGSESNSQNG